METKEWSLESTINNIKTYTRNWTKVNKKKPLGGIKYWQKKIIMETDQKPLDITSIEIISK